MQGLKSTSERVPQPHVIWSHTAQRLCSSNPAGAMKSRSHVFLPVLHRKTLACGNALSALIASGALGMDTVCSSRTGGL